MNTPLTILIVGGYGTFGGRLVELLEDEPRVTLFIAGRSLEKAQAYCAARGQTTARLAPLYFDRNGDLAAQLAAAKPDMVVDASGPFQDYGATPYALIEACIAQRCHYLDLADGSAFVAGVKAYDAEARAAGVFVLSGVSSFPVLTACVVRALSSDMTIVDTIHGGIAPSPFAGVGINVIRAITAYAGQPIKRRRRGQDSTGYPFTETLRATIAPPGMEPLDNRLFALVDVPDLQLLAENWPEAQTIWMGAAPVPEILHRALIGLAWLVRWRWLARLTPFAPLMHFVMGHVRWGAHRGGMFVAVTGKNADGALDKKSWHLLAEGADGPLIPSMAIEAIIRKILAGALPACGARSGLNALTLADYEALFVKRTISTGRRDDSAKAPSLYQGLLCSAFAQLPPAIHAMHSRPTHAVARGVATVRRGTNILARLIAAIMRFPAAGDAIPLKVVFTVHQGREVWRRYFGAESFSSVQYAGAGRWDHLLVERFGALAFAMSLVPRGDRLCFTIRAWRFLGIPMPLWLAPRTDAFEQVIDGRFNFNVRVSFPIIGLIVHYQGWLERS